jgi:hypothetical protein
LSASTSASEPPRARWGSSFDPERPLRTFYSRSHVGPSSLNTNDHTYAVSPDGQRFLAPAGRRYAPAVAHRRRELDVAAEKVGSTRHREDPRSRAPATPGADVRTRCRYHQRESRSPRGDDLRSTLKSAARPKVLRVSGRSRETPGSADPAESMFGSTPWRAGRAAATPRAGPAGASPTAPAPTVRQARPPLRTHSAARVRIARNRPGRPMGQSFS